MASIIDTVANLAKRRGLVFQSGEIYGGTKSAWDYGPLGVELKENIKRQWWRSMVTSRDDVVGLDSSIILPRQVWVASGDYKLEDDGTCPPFEPVRCHTFITESTFGLPIYRWPTQSVLFDEINAWWRRNAQEGRTSVILCYAFGKAQRVLSGVDASIGPIVVHGAVEPLNAVYRAAGVPLPPTHRVTDTALDKAALQRALVVAPPSAQGSPWMKRFGADAVDAFASGWMQVRGRRRRRGVDQGFVMSDHADWPGLLSAIAGTGAEHVRVTHGSVPVLVRWLNEHGLDAQAFETEYGDEDAGGADGGAEDTPASEAGP